MKQRIQITLDSKVYALIKDSEANKSRYIENLILKDFQDTHREKLVESIKQSLLEDGAFQEKFKYALSLANARSRKDDIEYTNDWGA